MRFQICPQVNWDKTFNISGKFNIRLEYEMDPTSCGICLAFPIVQTGYGTDRKGIKSIFGIVLGPISAGLELRYKMGTK